MLVKVEGADTDVVFNLCDELLQMDGVCDSGADGVELGFCRTCCNELLCFAVVVYVVLQDGDQRS